MSATTDGGFPDRGPAVFSVTTATLVLATVFVIARAVCRVGIVRKVSWDDYIMMVAWLFAFFLSFTIDLGTRNGLGRHDGNISSEAMPTLRRCEYVFSVLYNPALMATKTSILVFYLRLARNAQKILRLASWAVLVVVNIAGTILTFMNIFQCSPISAAWNPTSTAQQCIPLLTEFICSAPVNITTDLAILALPIPVLTGMRLPQRQKTILVITFALGVFVAVVDVVRIYYLQQAITNVSTGSTSDTASIFGDSPDFSWNASLALMWSAVEVNVGITCACIPTLKPLIIRILPAMLVDPDGSWKNQTRDSQYARNVETSKPESNSHSESSQFPAADADAQPPNLQEPPTVRVHGPDDVMSMMDFLRGPAGSAPRQQGAGAPRSSLLNPATVSTAGTSKRESSVYFGFVNMERPKSMLKTSVRESWKYCTVVSILFFLWGFSYGLLNTLNGVIADVTNMSTAETLGLTSAYFGGGYFFGPLLVGEWILRHDEHHRSKRRDSSQTDSIGGFKTTFIVGLLIYGTGTIMFWPSAVLTAFGGFMVSSFVVGFGLAVLETAANPFIALCGPPEYAEMRLLLAQGVQGVGSVLSGLLADNVFFKKVTATNVTGISTELLDVQWTYLAITLFCVLLALFFYYMPLPEVSDSALGRLANQLPVNPKKRLFGGRSLRTWCIILAVAAQWTYIGSQESMSIFFNDVLNAFAPASSDSNDADQLPAMALSDSNYLVVAHTAFAVSRFGCGYLAYIVVKHPNHRLIPTPRTMLTISTALCVLFALLVVLLKPVSNPNLTFVPIVLFFLAEGPLWPLIFALGLRGQGRRTKRAAAWLTMGGSGPAFWPFVIYSVTSSGGSIQTAFVLVVVLLVVALVYPLFLTFVRDAKAMVDPAKDKAARREGAGEDVEEGGDGGDLHRTVTEPDLDAIIARRRQMSSATRQSSLLERLAKGVGKGRRRSSALTASSTMGPAAEHDDSAEDHRRDSAQGHGEKQAQTLAPAQDRGQSDAPWEGQTLDTTILND